MGPFPFETKFQTVFSVLLLSELNFPTFSLQNLIENVPFGVPLHGAGVHQYPAHALLHLFSVNTWPLMPFAQPQGSGHHKQCMANL